MARVSEAVPFSRGTTASDVAPSKNVTAPVGVPVAGDTGLTVAVSVTAWPVADGFGVDVRLVLVLPALTI